jgi:hypothetical protein
MLMPTARSHWAWLQLAAIDMHPETRAAPASIMASIGQQRLSRAQLAGHPPSPPLPPPDDPLTPLDPLFEPPRVPLELPLNPLEEPDPPNALSELEPPSADPTKSPSPLMLTPPSSPALFGVLLHAANVRRAAPNTAPSRTRSDIANSLLRREIWPEQALVCNVTVHRAPAS